MGTSQGPSKCNEGSTLFSCGMVYTVGHTIGLPKVSHTIHLPILCTVISDHSPQTSTFLYEVISGGGYSS